MTLSRMTNKKISDDSYCIDLECTCGIFSLNTEIWSSLLAPHEIVIRVFVSHCLTRLVIYYITCNQPIKKETTNRDGELAIFFPSYFFQSTATEVQSFRCAITVKEVGEYTNRKVCITLCFV